MADETRRENTPADLGKHRERTASDIAEANEASGREGRSREPEKLDRGSPERSEQAGERERGAEG